MALTLIEKYDLEVTFAALDEESNVVSRKKTYEIVGTDFTTARTNANLFLTDLALATGANIVAHRLTEKYEDAVVPTSTFNLWRELVITFILAGAGTKKASHTVFAPSLNMVNQKVINLGHADVTAYINNFLETGGIVTISDGEFVKDTANVAASRIRQTPSGKTY